MSDPYRTSLRTAADWGLVALAVIAGAALTQPLGTQDGVDLSWTGEPMALTFLLGTALAVVAGRTAPSRAKGAVVEIGGATVAWLLPLYLANNDVDVTRGWGLWLYLLAATLMLGRALRVLVSRGGSRR